jgi:hypothetical protein
MRSGVDAEGSDWFGSGDAHEERNEHMAVIVCLLPARTFAPCHLDGKEELGAAIDW